MSPRTHQQVAARDEPQPDAVSGRRRGAEARTARQTGTSQEPERRFPTGLLPAGRTSPPGRLETGAPPCAWPRGPVSDRRVLLTCSPSAGIPRLGGGPAGPQTNPQPGARRQADEGGILRLPMNTAHRSIKSTDAPCFQAAREPAQRQMTAAILRSGLPIPRWNAPNASCQPTRCGRENETPYGTPAPRAERTLTPKSSVATFVP